jgi:hypothetical protein
MAMLENVEEFEKFILELKLSKRFRILKNEEMFVYYFANESSYFIRTDLEDDNLKISYLRALMGTNDGIALMDKRKDVYTFCNHPHLDDC